MTEMLHHLLQIHFANKAFVFPIILILLFVLFRKRESSGSTSLGYPSFKGMKGAPRSLRLRLRKPVLASLKTVFFLSLSIAALRPQQIALDSDEARLSSLVFAVDISKSMSSEDFSSAGGFKSRIEGVKEVLESLIKGSRNEQIALISFASSVNLNSPLSSDLVFVSRAVESLDVGQAGEKTAIGDAIVQALKRLKDVQSKARAIVLLSDGVNTTGIVSPRIATEAARKLNLSIYTIGIGGQRDPAFVSEDNEGSQEFDEILLKSIAASTGGEYFTTANIEDLRAILNKISNDQQNLVKTSEHFTVMKELSSFFSCIALVSMLSWQILSLSYFRKVP